ncbi:MAG: hypothetical protein DIZ80_09575 [endosymbiont of Galathealinum brachiosum]|uniref:DUF4124 domain-containing protein n=1 Tax=endosymbiont of Galathealinum brachiosum TaxID=2200906 RepID=A0A370DED5_9GAMM|nr:MAG: hypothetical protein DIZ80_09575 [endosymbiont of Galathealinum brachiosum]
MFIINTCFKRQLLNGIIVGFLFTPYAYAGLNKWVDEDGQVHYGDRVPSKYLRKEHSLLNEQGVTLRTSEAHKTEKEQTESQKKQKLEAAENKKRLIASRKKALRDRVLLDTFTTENDLMIARDARLDSIDSQISLSETLIKNDETKLSNIKGRIDSIEKTGRVAPENLHNEIISVGRQLENNYAFIEDKNNEREELVETFNQDVKRFRQLQKEKREARKKLLEQQ